MSEVAVRFGNVGKMYKIYGSRRDNLIDALGLQRVLPNSRERYREFWALRGIDFTLKRGARLGVIGRNGAGKSTLLKIVTGNLPATEGDVEVNGSVQALLEVGGGLHPEFTGRENAHASLGFLGLSADEIEEATEDIADFTELGRFLDQPFKTYSLGMQARLGLGIATTIRPEILIIDEVLGAGDAYFFAKSTARMRELLDSGASVLLVSHALDQIARFCDETIWIDRGRIVMRGSTTEVVKAYERFIRQLDERRLHAKNRKLKIGSLDGFAREGYTDSLRVALSVDTQGGHCNVSHIALLRDGEREDDVAVGDAQDADLSQSANVVVEAGGWSSPRRAEGVYFRTIGGGASNDAAIGFADFNLWFFYPDSNYALEFCYQADTPVSVTVMKGGSVHQSRLLEPSSVWTVGTIDVAPLEQPEEKTPEVGVSRWSGQGALMISDVRVVDDTGDDQLVFVVGRRLLVIIDIEARESGSFPLIPAALVFRTDGIVITRHVGAPTVIGAQEGDHIRAELDFGPLLLGNGSYLLSVGLYRMLDLDDIEPSEFYDYFDKSFEFQVVGSPALHNELVRHPGSWTISTVNRRREPSTPAA